MLLLNKLSPVFLLFLSLLPASMTGQVLISSTPGTPLESAILEISSTSKGLLIPRMTTGDRDAISTPVISLMIYNTTTNKYNYRVAGGWIEMAAGNMSKIVDADGDTKVDVETTPDADYISFVVAGNERMSIFQNGIQTFFPGGSIAIGEEAGATDDGTFNFNTTLGTSAGASLITGEHNVNLGAAAGSNNAAGSDNTYLGYFAGLVSGASNNVFVGSHSGETNSTGFENIFIGRDAGRLNVTGAQNVFVGMLAGAKNLSSSNTFLGANAGMENTGGSGNTFIGKDAGKLNTTASNNIFAGFDAGHNTTTGSDNTFLGKDAGRSNLTGASNVFIGSSAGRNNTVFGNTFVGAYAGADNTTGMSNTFVGTAAGNTNSSASFNTLVGFGSGANSDGGEKNTFLGFNTGSDNQGSFNVFVGSSAGETNQVGTENTFVGESAGYLNSSGTGNTFIGRNTGKINVAGASNTFVGAGAGDVNTASNNTFLGKDAGGANTTGISNTFIGKDAGLANLTGGSNTFVGAGAGDVNTASDNTFIGKDAGGANTSGSTNSFFGSNAGAINTSGTKNVFIGREAGTFNTTGSNNAVLGEGALINNNAGSFNTAVGNLSGMGNTSGTKNTFIGANARAGFSTLTNATAIGDSAIVNANNSVILGHNASVGIGTSSPDPSAKTEIISTNQGFLMPRMSTAQRHAISSPAPGLLLFDTDKMTLYFYDGALWQPMTYTNENSLPPQRRDATDGLPFNHFGHSVSISGDYSIIGAPYDSTAGIVSKGAAYIFKRTNGNWTQEAKLTAADGLQGDQFGISVSISGDYVIVGAFGDDDGKGSAYIFLRSGTNWNQQAKITSIGGLAGDNFGFAVSIAGDKAIVGAPLDDVAADVDEGSVRVFNRSGVNWNEVQTLLTGSATGITWFGYSVSLMTDYLVVGAPKEGFDTEGRAHVFVFGGGAWSLQATLDSFLDDSFYGWSVSIQNNYVVIGAPKYNDNGVVAILKRTGSTWSAYSSFLEGTTDFGSSVAITENYLVVGEPGSNRSHVFENTGTAYVFSRNIEDPVEASVSLGFSSAISEHNIITGAPGALCSLCFTGYLGNVLFLNME